MCGGRESERGRRRAAGTCPPLRTLYFYREVFREESCGFRHDVAGRVLALSVRSVSLSEPAPVSALRVSSLAGEPAICVVVWAGVSDASVRSLQHRGVCVVVAQWSPEEAREYAASGGKAKAARQSFQRKSPEEKARELLARRAPELAEELLKAARGEDPYDELPEKDRLAALIRALEWGLGRPATRKPEKPDDRPEEGLVIE